MSLDRLKKLLQQEAKLHHVALAYIFAIAVVVLATFYFSKPNNPSTIHAQSLTFTCQIGAKMRSSPPYPINTSIPIEITVQDSNTHYLTDVYYSLTTTGPGVITTPTGSPGVESPTVSYSYGGNFTVTDTQTDNLGDRTSCSTTISIAESPAPSAPTITSVVVDINAPTALIVNWSASTPGSGQSISGYDIYDATTGTEISMPANSSQVVFPGLSCSETNSFYAVAIQSDGQRSSNSNEVSGTTMACSSPSPPSTPTITSVVATSSSVLTVNWSASTPGSGQSISGYDIYDATTSSEIVGSSSQRSAEFTGLSCSETNSFYAVAIQSDGQRSSNSNEVTQTTTACSSPSPPSSPTSLSPPSTPIKKSSSSGSTTAPLVNTPTVVTLGPPGIPTGFVASVGQGGVVVNLSWQAPSTGSVVNYYEIDRSTDNGNTWTILNSQIQGTSYSDLNTNFNTQYLYRLSAIDTSSGVSGYIYANVTTTGFVANAGPDQSVILTSPDGISTATIANGVLTQPASCALEPDLNLRTGLSKIKNLVLVAGPYSITCKTVTGQTITNFNEPISITINLSKKITGKYLKLEYYKKTTSQNWSQINQIGAVNGKVTFQLTNSLSYVILGQPKHTPWWVTLAIILFIIIIIFIVSRFVFRWLIKKHLEDENVESYRKEWGL